MERDERSHNAREARTRSPGARMIGAMRAVRAIAAIQIQTMQATARERTLVNKNGDEVDDKNTRQP